MATIENKANMSRCEARKIFKKYHNVEIVLKNWHVHHVDSNPFNNNIVNLELISAGDHKRLHNTTESKAQKALVQNDIIECASKIPNKKLTLSQQFDRLQARITKLYASNFCLV